VRRKLAGLRYDGLPQMEDREVRHEGKTVGRRGNAVHHPRFGPIGLAVLRTEELLAAHRFDGAERSFRVRLGDFVRYLGNAMLEMSHNSSLGKNPALGKSGQCLAVFMADQENRFRIGRNLSRTVEISRTEDLAREAKHVAVPTRRISFDIHCGSPLLARRGIGHASLFSGAQFVLRYRVRGTASFFSRTNILV
jgi:hypothetical protein